MLLWGNISYLFIYVHDFDLMVSFYRDTLGFDLYFIERGNCAFFRTRQGSAPAIAIYAGRKSTVSPDSHWFIAIDVDDIDAAVATLRGRGLQIEKIEAGANEFYAKFKDPEGNVLELHSPR